MTRFALAAVLALLMAPAAHASHAQPPLDITKMDYDPIGHLKPGDPVPPDAGTACDELFKPLMSGKIFNPSGKWNAFDTNMFEATCLPYRGAGDQSDLDPMGNGGEPKWGFCAGAGDPNDESAYKSGVCPNHQLEYVDYYEATMKEILKDFGVTFRRYEFENQGSGNTSAGRAINPAAIVPGGDHPDESIVIGAHYDQTIDGPASAWDSAEGHAELIRVAKLLADYWKATGTRPSATIKFIPWDGEESGTLGSLDYVNNNIVPDEEFKVRGYWNTDPCAGGYPARRYGEPADRVNLGIQVGASNEERVQAFNERAPQLVEQVFEHLDDTIEQYPDNPEIFIATSEGGPLGGDIGKDVFIGTDRPILFSSDWRNFIAVGIPFFSPGPEVTGPNSGGDPGLNTPGNLEGVYQFHSPMDNVQHMQRYTGANPAGTEWSEGWMKGIEMCAHLLGWGMLQHDQGGAQAANTDVVAYYEALPNEAETGKLVTFDGGGSHQLADAGSRSYVPKADLQLKWEFGDGAVAYGEKVKHAYRRVGVYQSKLTVTNRRTGASDTMIVPITVVEGTGTETDPPGQDVDTGALPAKGSVVACQARAGFGSAAVRPRGRGLRFEFSSGSPNPVVIELFQAAKGKRVRKPRRIVRLTARESFTWNGSTKIKRGSYYVRMTAVSADGRREVRSFALDFTNRFRSRRPFARPDSCGVISLFRLGSPVFGGRRKLEIAIATTRATRVRVEVRKGSRRVKRFTRRTKANRAVRLRLSPKGLRRGEYRVIARAGGKRYTLYARML